MGNGLRLRRVNEIAGIFVILCVLAALTALFFVAGAQRWFTRFERVRILFPEDGSHGLRNGAEVEILGAVAGDVGEIAIDKEGRMFTTVRLEPDFFRFVREDSRAVIRRRIGLVSDVYLELTPGHGPPLPRTDARLEAVAEKELLAMVADVLTRVERSTLPSLQEFGQLAADLRDPRGPLQTLLARMNRLADNLERGEGAIPRLLNDKAFMDEFEKTLEGVNASLADLQKTLRSAEAASTSLGSMTDNVNRVLESMPRLLGLTEEVLVNTRAVMADLRKTTERLPGITRNLGKESEALPGLLLQTRTTLEEIERLVLGLQRHWLVRGYIEPPAAPGRIPPEAVESGGAGR
ncbi:MAG: hypothetical protein Kow00128_20660 [Deltaproteobacteria bacterium]